MMEAPFNLHGYMGRVLGQWPTISDLFSKAAGDLLSEVGKAELS